MWVHIHVHGGRPADGKGILMCAVCPSTQGFVGIWVSPWDRVYSSPHVPEAVNLHMTPREAQLYMRVCVRVVTL